MEWKDARIDPPKNNLKIDDRGVLSGYWHRVLVWDRCCLTYYVAVLDHFDNEIYWRQSPGTWRHDLNNMCCMYCELPIPPSY